MRYFGFVLVVAVAASCASVDGESVTEPTDSPSGASSGMSGEPDERPTAAGVLHEDVVANGDRVFDLYEPTPGGDHRPAVIVFHGMPSNPTSVRNRSQLDVLADREGFVVAYGRGEDERWQADVESADVDYVRNVVSSLVGEWDADPDRIYVAGMSNGGDMAITAVLSLPELIAAAAPIVPASTMNVEGVVAELAKPVDVMGFVGGQDSRFESGLKLLAAMRQGADCRQGETIETTELVTTTWQCADGHTFAVQEVVEGSHAWFGSPSSTDPDPIWASEAMWQFFESVSS